MICSFQRCAGNLGSKKKFFENHFFLKLKFEIDSLDLYLRGKLGIIPFGSMNQKLREVFVGASYTLLFPALGF